MTPPTCPQLDPSDTFCFWWTLSQGGQKLSHHYLNITDSFFSGLNRWLSPSPPYALVTLASQSPLEPHPPLVSAASQSLPSWVNIRHLVFSPPGHNSPSFSEMDRLLQITLSTPATAKLKGFPHWVHLSPLKPFIPSAQDNCPSYISTPTGPCSLKFQKMPKSTSLPG